MTNTQISEVKIRQATYADLPILLEFEQAIIEIERPFDPTLKTTQISYYDLKGMISAKEVQVLVAVKQNKIIASGYAHIMQSEIYLKHKKNVYLGFMFVVPDCRGQGINRLIVDALTQWSISQGVFEVRLDVYSQNLAAVKAYEKAGFSKNLIEMRIDLTAKEPV